MNRNSNRLLTKVLNIGFDNMAMGAALTLVSCLGLAASAQDQTQQQTDSIDVSGSQGFALFEDIETSANRATSPTRRSNRESRATIAEPEFTLLGTSRIGDKYSAIIQHRDGEAIVVQAQPGVTTAIPDHRDYSIVNMEAGTVSIRYPGDSPCVAFSDRGVSCNTASNTAELALTTGEPLAPRNPSLNVAELADAELSAGSDEEAVQGGSANPFAALRASQDGANSPNPADANAGGNSRFTPRRINPEDVPPGMRVVSTPFGDRLVEQ